MATPIIMPKQGQSVETCLITEWFKNPGDAVNEGDLLFAYETDKATFDEEAKADGILLAVFFEEGDEVPVLENVCVIGAKGESAGDFRPVAGSPEEEKTPGGLKPEKELKIEPLKEPPAVNDAKLIISPRARRKAKDLGVEITGMRGTGVKNRIIEKDVVTWAASRPMITPLAKRMIAEARLVFDREKHGAGSRVTSRDLYKPETTVHDDCTKIPISKIRKIIAENMHRSLQGSAQLTHHLSADARKILELRDKIKTEPERYPNITINDMVCFAVIKSLQMQPYMNAHFMGDHMLQFAKVNLGMAVDTERGLMVPALQDAGQYNLTQLSVQLRDLAARCQSGNMDPDLLIPASGTFTVSNLGAYGIELFTPVLNLPQVGILGVNTIKPQAADLGNNTFGFVPHIGLSLTYDHRAVDGAPASAFLRTLKEQIEIFFATI